VVLLTDRAGIGTKSTENHKSLHERKAGELEQLRARERQPGGIRGERAGMFRGATFLAQLCQILAQTPPPPLACQGACYGAAKTMSGPSLQAMLL